MTSRGMPASAGTSTSAATFAHFAGASGVITGVSSLLYAVFFLLVKGSLHDALPSVLLAIGGFFALPVALAIYQAVREADASFALFALLLAAVGYLGTAVHGVYGLATLIPQKTASVVLTQVDPRGFVAFGLTGVAVFLLAWLIVRSGAFPRALGYVGYILAVCLVALFLGTLLTGNDTKSLAILVPGGLASLIATPAWNLWLGLLLWRTAGR
jgi:hypothetical protein